MSGKAALVSSNMSAPKTVRKGAAHVRKNEMMGRAFCQSLVGFGRMRAVGKGA